MNQNARLNSEIYLYMQFCGIYFMHPITSLVDGRNCLKSGQWQDVLDIKHILPLTRLLIRMHERNAIKLHVQAFLMMSTGMFEIFRKNYN